MRKNKRSKKTRMRERVIHKQTKVESIIIKTSK